MQREIVSRHFFRRTARAKAERLNAGHDLTHPEGPTHVYRVEKASRGPFRWYVVEIPQPTFTPA